MKRPRQSRRRGGKPDTSATLRRVDKLQIWGIFAGMIAMLLVYGHFHWTRCAAIALDTRLAQWKQRYHLSEEQVVELRRIERDYHGNGNPLFAPAHSTEEQRAHSRLLREVMKLPDPATTSDAGLPP